MNIIAPYVRGPTMNPITTYRQTGITFVTFFFTKNVKRFTFFSFDITLNKIFILKKCDVLKKTMWCFNKNVMFTRVLILASIFFSISLVFVFLYLFLSHGECFVCQVFSFLCGLILNSIICIAYFIILLLLFSLVV